MKSLQTAYRWSKKLILDFSSGGFILLLAASNQIAAYNQSRKHYVYAVENVSTGHIHFTCT